MFIRRRLSVFESTICVVRLKEKGEKKRKYYLCSRAFVQIESLGFQSKLKSSQTDLRASCVNAGHYHDKASECVQAAAALKPHFCVGKILWVST